MNERERFLEVMVNHNTNVRTLKWEFGYWGGTMNNWYKQGLPKKNYAQIPTEYTTPSSSIYTKTWLAENKFVVPGEYPVGYVIMAGGLYWPTQGFAKDNDVRDFFNMDQTQQLVDVNMFFHPMFDIANLRWDFIRLRDCKMRVRVSEMMLRYRIALRIPVALFLTRASWCSVEMKYASSSFSRLSMSSSKRE